MRAVCVCLLLMCCTVFAEEMLVTVQSQSQQEMDLLTAAIDADVQNVHNGMRTTLGAIEATMSRGVDSDDPYFVAPVLTVPTWAMLHDVQFDRDANLWTFEYKTMRMDPGSLNQFHRVLYMTKQGGVVTGDVNNECLQAGVETSACLQYLQTHYTVPQALNLEDSDYLVFAETGDTAIVSSVNGETTSMLQTVTIQIPHQRIRDGQSALAERTQHDHPTLGVQTQWTFGIGMLFHGVGNNVIIFDRFNLIENSFEQVAISRSNAYALARHVSFWTEQVQSDSSIRVATIEYVIDELFTLQNVSTSLNDGMVTSEECAEMQTKLDSLENKKCIYERALCTAHVLGTSSSDGQNLVYISYAIPLPARAGSDFKINTLLTLQNKNTGQDLLSSLNFQTHTSPQEVCSTAQSETFDPSQHVDVSLYKGHALVAQPISGVYTVQNSSDTAMGLPEALLTLVLKPKDTTAYTYFQSFPDESVNLDELYISHTLDPTLLPDTINNALVGTGSGRSTIQLDTQLLQNCPMESHNNYAASAKCLTTHDWGLSGPISRPVSSPISFFVRRVTNSAEDAQWLQDNVFAQNQVEANTFLSNTEALINSCTASYADCRSKTQIYYIFPVYAWNDQSPIGLQDKALISFAWSISKESPQSRRRLLADTSSKTAKLAFKSRRRPSKLLAPALPLSKQNVSDTDKVKSWVLMRRAQRLL